MENMSTAEQYGGYRVERLREANHAHVVRILPQLGRLVTAVQTRETGRLSSNPTTWMATWVRLATAGSLVLGAFLLGADTLQDRQRCT